MNDGRLVFSQVMDLVHREQLDRCLKMYPMPRISRSFSGRDQFLTMAFAQMTFREGLRDIEACLRGSRHLYAMGIRGSVTRTNLAYANEFRDWRVFAALAQVLIRKARRLYGPDDRDLKIDEMVTPWIRRLSIFACRCFRGLISVPPKPPSRCTR